MRLVVPQQHHRIHDAAQAHQRSAEPAVRVSAQVHHGPQGAVGVGEQGPRICPAAPEPVQAACARERCACLREHARELEDRVACGGVLADLVAAPLVLPSLAGRGPKRARDDLSCRHERNHGHAQPRALLDRTAVQVNGVCDHGASHVCWRGPHGGDRAHRREVVRGGPLAALPPLRQLARDESARALPVGGGGPRQVHHRRPSRGVLPPVRQVVCRALPCTRWSLGPLRCGVVAVRCAAGDGPARFRGGLR
mmetsp:Transcript_43286/g.125126  ORF Transcript_43286/g.125126 Transcript_43286/m.125126 type:complete len:252 (-) Transcript_43286:301-1056(-)